MRLLKCSEIIEVSRFMDMYKNYSKARVERIIEKDETQAEDMETDVIHITIQIMIGKIFQIIKLSIIIMNICYFLGIAWFIVCMVSKDTQDLVRDGTAFIDPDYMNNENFLDYYNIWDNTMFHNVILGTYFSFTTLSTVGFGDLSPRSDPERLMCSLILMIGVGVFSMVLG